LYKEGEEMQHVDSVVLTIPYSKKYPLAENSDFFEGRSFTLTIYEVDEDIDTSAKNNGIYNIHSEVAYKPTPLYEDEVTLHPALSTDSTAPRNINFHLKDEKAFGERISRILEQALDNQNSDEFQTNFKGLYFVIKDAESPEQSIVADFNTDMASGTNLCVYFNGNLDTIRASSYYRFAINTHFTQIKKNRNNSIIKMWDSIAGQEKLYIESVGGSRIRLKFPNLRALLNDTTHIAINRAALIFKVANSSATGILAPSILHLYKYINSQSLESIIDYGYNGGGTYDAAKGEYRLYITRWMQDLMYNKDKEIPYLDLSAVPETRFMYPTQVEFYGTNSGKNKVRLEVLYSTIQK
jgi:hypothetical protein